ncbi:MAG: hypothetical protein ACYTGS_22405 [Planctomycetota bacterium]|jgi:hypothetical protein
MKNTISFDREGISMDMEYTWFQRCLAENYSLRPGALRLDTHSEREAKHIVEQIAIESDAETITILAGHEHGKRPHAICGWKKDTSGTVKYLPPEDKDVENYLEELNAQQIGGCSLRGTHQLPPA